MRISRSPIVLFSFLGGVGIVKARDIQYEFFDVGTIEVGSNTDAYDVNDHGLVGGTSGCLAYLWHNGVMEIIGDDLDEGTFAQTKVISENGLVAAGNSPNLLVWFDGVIDFMDLPVGCDENGYPEGMNAKGTMISGTCELDDGTNRFTPSVYWTEDGSALDLGFLPDSPADVEGYAEDVNNAGVVVGKLSYGSDGNRAFIWSDGVMSAIVNTLGGVAGNAYAINNLGLVVGNAETSNGFPAMSYDMNTGIMSTLGAGTALGVNDRGHAVGRDILDFVDVHAILYKDGAVIDLHQFFPTNIRTSRAEAINNYGWVVGYGNDAGSTKHGWLLVPVYDKGDFDGDGDIDHQDFQHFQRCFSADDFPNGRLHIGCRVFDFDYNNDLDLDDYAAFQSAFTGPTAPNKNPNGPG